MFGSCKICFTFADINNKQLEIMKTLSNPIEVTATKNFCFGSYAKGTYYSATIGDKFKVIAETKTYYITENKINNKLPKWACE